MSLRNEAVSVIIPTLNRPAFLKETVKSLLSQTNSPMEIIIINSSPSLHNQEIKQITESASNIKYFEISDRKSVSAARNYGLHKAKGNYILFIDDDDILHPEMLESSLMLFKNTDDIDVAVCLYDVFFTNGNTDYTYPISYLYNFNFTIQNPLKLIDMKKLVPKDSLKENPLKSFLRFTIPINSCLIKRKSIGGTRFDETITQGEDYLFWFTLASKGCRFSGSEYIHAYVRRHANNITKNKKISLKERRYYLEKILKMNIVKEREDLFFLHLKLFRINFKVGEFAALKYFFIIIKSPILLFKETVLHTITLLKARKRLLKFYFMD